VKVRVRVRVRLGPQAARVNLYARVVLESPEDMLPPAMRHVKTSAVARAPPALIRLEQRIVQSRGESCRQGDAPATVVLGRKPDALE
jgi:hypothetical protein